MDADGCRRQVARDVRARDDHRGRPVDRGVAVVEAERPGDQASAQILLHREALPIHGSRVQRGVRPCGERDLAEVFARRAELVHVPDGVERHPVGRRHGAEGDQPLREPGDRTGARADAEPPGARRRARLGDRPVHERVSAEAGRHGERRMHDRRDLRRPLESRGVPPELEPEGVLDVGRAGTGEADVAGHRSGIAGEAVDVGGLEPRVGDRSERRLAGEVETGAVEPAADLRLPDAGENRASLEVLLRARPDGGRHGLRHTGSGLRRRTVVVGLEEGKGDVVVHHLERHLDGHADGDAIGLAPDEVRREPQVRLLHELDERDDVRDVHPRHPGLVIDGVAGDGCAAADCLRPHVGGVAARTDGPWRVDVPAAGPTARDLEPARTARPPEGFRLRLEGGQRRAHRRHSACVAPRRRRRRGRRPPRRVVARS